MFTSIAGRSVVVTGGSRGIGRGIARVFATAGANVLLTARDEAVLAAAVEELQEVGGQVSGLSADISDRARATGWRGPPSSDTAASTCCAPTPASSRPPGSRT